MIRLQLDAICTCTQKIVFAFMMQKFFLNFEWFANSKIFKQNFPHLFFAKERLVLLTDILTIVKTCYINAKISSRNSSLSFFKRPVQLMISVLLLDFIYFFSRILSDWTKAAILSMKLKLTHVFWSTFIL